MKRWQVLVGVGLLIVLASSWVILQSAAANSREAAEQSREAVERERAARKAFPPQELVTPKHFLEVGKIYNFVVARDSGQQTEKCEVIEQPHDGWVKVRNLKGSKPTVAWFRLSQIVFVVALEKDD